MAEDRSDRRLDDQNEEDRARATSRVARLAGPAMSFPGFGPGGPRRCSFCNRREDSVAHLVAARGTYICDGCVTLAQEAIGSAPSEPRLLRIKPQPRTPADRSEAEHAIERAYETVFGDSADTERCAAIENGANLIEAMHLVRERLPARDQMDVSVEYVRFLAEDEAEVHFVLYFPGGMPMPRMPETGHAVLSNGEWKVARETWCRLVSRIGVQCPPP